MRPQISIRNRADRSGVITPTREKNDAQEAQSNGNLVFSEFNKDILLIRDYENVKIQTLIAYDVVIIDYNEPKKASEFLREIRASVYDELYLKPILISTHGNEVSPIDLQLSDGVIHSPSIEPIRDVVENIIEKTDEILRVSSDFKGRKLMLKLIRFLYTRDKALEPVPAAQSHMGYSYPFLDANIETSEYAELVDLLEIGRDNGLLQADFEDHVHLCNECHSGFINYREKCPKCNTHKFKSQHTIHHFVCGYVGPESDFVSDNRLECPKCDRQLRHIGVDYDKPSLVMECEHGHIFQEPDMKTYCFSCHTEASPEDLLTYAINFYELTASGAEAAVSGKVKEKEESELPDGFVSLPVFKTFLKMEIERQKLLDKSSVVSYINLMLCPKTLKTHQTNFSEFVNDVARIIKNQLRSSEIVTFLNDEVFLVITPEASVEEMNERLDQLKAHTLGMIRSACQGDKSDEIVFDSFEISGDESMKVLDQINQHINLF